MQSEEIALKIMRLQDGEMDISSKIESQYVAGSPHTTKTVLWPSYVRDLEHNRPK